MTLDPETGEPLQWTRRGQWDRLRVEEARRPVEALDMGDLTFDDSVLSGRRRLPCFTTPALDENGRAAPKGCRGKIPSDAQQRWSAEPWHYMKEAMVISSDGKLQIPPPAGQGTAAPHAGGLHLGAGGGATRRSHPPPPRTGAWRDACC